MLPKQTSVVHHIARAIIRCGEMLGPCDVMTSPLTSLQSCQVYSEAYYMHIMLNTQYMHHCVDINIVHGAMYHPSNIP